MYGRGDVEWDELVREGTAFLDRCVRTGQRATYTQLNNHLVEATGLRAFDFSTDADRAAVGHLLGRIVEQDYPARGYMLSAAVTCADGSDAGTGFYRLAEAMGLLLPGQDRLAFWIEQLRGLGVR